MGGGGEELTLNSGAYAGDLALGSEFNPDSALSSLAHPIASQTSVFLSLRTKVSIPSLWKA